MGNGRSIHSGGADQSTPRLIVVTRSSTENLSLTEMFRIPKINQSPNTPLWVSDLVCHASGLRRATASNAPKRLPEREGWSKKREQFLYVKPEVLPYRRIRLHVRAYVSQSLTLQYDAYLYRITELRHIRVEHTRSNKFSSCVACSRLRFHAPRLRREAYLRPTDDYMKTPQVLSPHHEEEGNHTLKQWLPHLSLP